MIVFLECRRPRFHSWVRKICGRRDRLPTPVILGFPGGSAGKESACNVEDLGSIPGTGRSPGEGNSYPLQYSCLENSMDCIVHGVAKSWTQLSYFQFQEMTLIKKKLGLKSSLYHFFFVTFYGCFTLLCFDFFICKTELLRCISEDFCED